MKAGIKAGWRFSQKVRMCSQIMRPIEEAFRQVSRGFFVFDQLGDEASQNSGDWSWCCAELGKQARLTGWQWQIFLQIISLKYRRFFQNMF